MIGEKGLPSVLPTIQTGYVPQGHIKVVYHESGDHQTALSPSVGMKLSWAIRTVPIVKL